MSDSVEENNIDHSADQTNKKSRAPPNTSFRQQRIKSWQPLLTPKTVLPLFFILGIIFGPLGGGLLYASSTVQELVVDYTDCENLAKYDTFTEIPSKKYKAAFDYSFVAKAKSPTPSWKLSTTHDNDLNLDIKVCKVRFHVPSVMKAPIFLYYRLTNFYQNHRRYAKSLDEKQIRGYVQNAEDVKSSGCYPLEANEEGKPYYPCGLIANSLFNDTFSMLNRVVNEEIKDFYQLNSKNIAWASDASRFKKTQYNPSDVVPPPNWVLRYPNGYTAENMPDLSTMEELQVWMRTAGLPTFSKLARRNDKDHLSPGTYELDIGLHFPVKDYDGTKSIVLSTRSVLGGKNPFLGIAYIVVSVVSVVLGTLFTLRHFIRPRKLADHRYLNWDSEDNNIAPRLGGL